MTSPVTPPEGDCPKCGRPNAWARSSPTYHEAESSWDEENVNEEYLAWGCSTCGFEKRTRTLGGQS